MRVPAQQFGSKNTAFSVHGPDELAEFMLKTHKTSLILCSMLCVGPGNWNDPDMLIVGNKVRKGSLLTALFTQSE